LRRLLLPLRLPLLVELRLRLRLLRLFFLLPLLLELRLLLGLRLLLLPPLPRTVPNQLTGLRPLHWVWAPGDPLGFKIIIMLLHWHWL